MPGSNTGIIDSSKSVDAQKQISLQQKVISRLEKELVSYEKEADHQRTRIAIMRQENKDPYDIKKQEEVLAETVAMLPDCKKRLDTAKETLSLLTKEETV